MILASRLNSVDRCTHGDVQVALRKTFVQGRHRCDLMWLRLLTSRRALSEPIRASPAAKHRVIGVELVLALKKRTEGWAVSEMC